MICSAGRRFVVVLVLVVAVPAFCRDWAQWRGPFFNGSTDEKNLPVSWSATENTKWVRPLPGPSGATAVISKGRVFVTSMVNRTGGYVALCFDERTGEQLWRRDVGSDSRRFHRNNLCSPSPVADGKNVYFLYGNGPLVAFDFEGNEVWSRDIEKEYGNLALQFGYSSSPLLYEGKLHIPVIRRNKPYRRPEADGALDSFVMAIDAKTGRTIWKERRTTDAFDEGMEAYGTAIPFERNGKIELLNIGGDFVTAHEAIGGKELWRFEYWHEKVRDTRIIPSLVAGDGLIFGTKHKHNGLFALRPPADGKAAKVVWEFDEAAPDCSTPLFYRGRLYAFDGIRRGKVVTCFDPKTGRRFWQGKVGGRGPWRASLTASDGKLYCICETGEIVVLRAGGDEFEILFQTKIDETPIQSSISIANGCLFIRTAENLYCIGK